MRRVELKKGYLEGLVVRDRSQVSGTEIGEFSSMIRQQDEMVEKLLPSGSLLNEIEERFRRSQQVVKLP